MLNQDLKKYVAELFGCFVLTFMGCASAVIAGDEIGFLGISIAFGLTVVTMAYAIGSISGCHINPAISIAMTVAGKLKPKDCVAYVISQCIGAVLAALLLSFIAGGKETADAITNLGQNGYGEASPGKYNLVSGFVAEVVLTFIFLIVIFGATSKNAAAGFAGLAIGLALVLIHLIGIPITGTSVNPARSLGPALVLGGTALSQVWVFLVAPTIGAILAALGWTLLIEKD